MKGPPWTRQWKENDSVIRAEHFVNVVLVLALKDARNKCLCAKTLYITEDARTVGYTVIDSVTI